MAQPREKIIARMKALEPDYKRYSDPDVMLKFKASMLDDVWGIYGGGIIKPETASFVIGRIFQALDPYAKALRDIAIYEQLETQLAESARSEEAGHAMHAMVDPTFGRP